MMKLAMLVLLLSCPVALAADMRHQTDEIKCKIQPANSPLGAKLLAQTGKNMEEPEAVFVGICGPCHVDSRVNAHIKVYINGRYRGTIEPWGDIFPIVGDCAGEVTHLYAVSTCGRYYWSRTVYADYGDFHWILYP
jgi:hypothetical protein